MWISNEMPADLVGAKREKTAYVCMCERAEAGCVSKPPEVIKPPGWNEEKRAMVNELHNRQGAGNTVPESRQRAQDREEGVAAARLIEASWTRERPPRGALLLLLLCRQL